MSGVDSQLGGERDRGYVDIAQPNPAIGFACVPSEVRTRPSCRSFAARIVKVATSTDSRSLATLCQWDSKAHNMNPKSRDAKRLMLGTTNGISVALTPNHFASVAAY